MANAKVDQLVTWGQGARQQGSTKPETVSPDTPFRVGSISKTFTALTLLALVEAGRVSLETPVRKIIPAGYFENPWHDTHPLRLIHLLEHTAGLTDISAKAFANNDPRPLTLEQAMQLSPGARLLRWPPGQRHSYSNASPGLTSLIIEKLSGNRFETYARTKLLLPLGMKQADYLETAYIADHLPGGFKADGTTPIPYWHMSFRAFGALNASPREMSRFLHLLLNRGEVGGRQLFQQTTMKEFFRPRTGLAAQAGLTLGYAQGIYGWVRGRRVFYGHGGDADGYLSRYGVLPDHGLGYFVVINTDNPPAFGEIRRRVERYLIAQIQDDLPPPPPLKKLKRTTLAGYQGTYYPSTTRFRLAQWQRGELPTASLTAENGTLQFRYRGRRIRLLPVSEHLFRRPGDPVASVALVFDANGALHLQGELGNFIRQ